MSFMIKNLLLSLNAVSLCELVFYVPFYLSSRGSSNSALNGSLELLILANTFSLYAVKRFDSNLWF